MDEFEGSVHESVADVELAPAAVKPVGAAGSAMTVRELLSVEATLAPTGLTARILNL